MEGLIFLILLPLYFLPTIIAIHKQHPHRTPIILVNILGGFIGGLGWVVALVWCFVWPKDAGATEKNVASEIGELHHLMEKGIISESEFTKKKESLLNSG